MGKVLEFRRVKQEVKKTKEIRAAADDIEDEISGIVNDSSLTAANRHWILENMLMNMDDQLEEYKKELVKAETKLDTLVEAAEREIASAYREFSAHVGGITRAVKKLTRNSSCQNRPSPSADLAADTPDS